MQKPGLGGACLVFMNLCIFKVHDHAPHGLHPQECKDPGALMLPVVTLLFSSESGNSVHFKRDEGTREWSDRVLDAKGWTCPGLSVSGQLCHVASALVLPVVPSFHWTLKLPHERVCSSHGVQNGMGWGGVESIHPLLGFVKINKGMIVYSRFKKKKKGTC